MSPTPSKQALEARIRERRELEQYTDAIRKRVGDDFYVRYTLSFRSEFCCLALSRAKLKTNGYLPKD